MEKPQRNKTSINGFTILLIVIVALVAISLPLSNVSESAREEIVEATEAEVVIETQNVEIAPQVEDSGIPIEEQFLHIRTRLRGLELQVEELHRILVEYEE